MLPATDDDWGKEFLALTMAVKVVGDYDDAMEHLHTYTSGHSEAIVTQDYTAGQRFMREIDAAAVYWNASTQFTDGAQFGLGAEVGISTQKLHARGPMALEEMTTYKVDHLRRRRHSAPLAAPTSLEALLVLRLRRLHHGRTRRGWCGLLSRWRGYYQLLSNRERVGVF